MDNLKLIIQDDIKAAMKNKDAFLLGVLRMVSAAIKNKELEKRTKVAKNEPARNASPARHADASHADWHSDTGGLPEKLDELSQLTEEEIIGVVSSEAKKRKDAASEFESGGRPELAEKELKEAELLKKYLPEQMLEDEIRELVVEAVKKVGATSPQEMGKVMGALMPQLKGKADGAVVQKIVQEELKK
ncbi:MAG: aspartyl-tRNA amidotransferase [Candidatus Portnoybacteria bacterium CG09_land_8_20_14_0_10_44_13]|uniref:Aspartyl-tRNA amidotransferase n=1 Tax=Candidatus Portnoybacteria bacterium CG09_land_8_20_14_0_10_44_13 TaxID=1974811 RepID=A0A2H0WYR5_9BACT|nr:MAG: hypothetical protein AUK17_02230 [Parcubacteria group bacterium CG2_30_44_18]PIS17059.1 MAG: aspartyl-tRNA amidotransferase [Candidatus Portnoybacteria bacterium CG09_land_8_20_14_0_10_44_13]